jgi:hypothetical protein
MIACAEHHSGSAKSGILVFTAPVFVPISGTERNHVNVDYT